MKNKYILMQTSIGDYRQSVINKLYENFAEELEVYCGDVYFDNTTLTRVKFNGKQTSVKNYYFFSRNFLFQYGAIKKSIFSDNVILELNPRIINTWVIAVARRLMIKPVVMWGHAWPRKGKDSKSDIVRNILRNLATHLVVYTEQQKNELHSKYPYLNIIVAPNSLYPEKFMSFDFQSERKNFIYVGRIVKNKKVDLLIIGFIKFISRSKNKHSKLIIIGEGPELENCKKIIDSHNFIKDRIVFTGHVSDIKKLREYYKNAIVSISPGYVGLSITQSFAFGVPMIIAKNEPHSPEIEAAIDGFNAFFFESDSIKDLSNKLEEIFNKRFNLHTNGNSIVAKCKEKYSSDVMADRLEMALRLEVEYSPDNKKKLFSRLIRHAIRSLRKYKVKLKMRKRFQYGTNCYWGAGAKIQSPEFFFIANNFSAGANFFVQTNFKCASDCLISSNVSFVGNDHDLNSRTNSFYWSGKKPPSTIVLEGNNFIGYGATLIGNLNIGVNSVIGANSLVLKDVPPNVIIAGVPAKVITKIPHYKNELL